MSLKSSRDSVEQLYGSIVLENFPNYEKFWVEFIGDPRAKQVQPYEYSFPKSVHPKEQRRINEVYEKIQITHYTLFCHLAGAHFQGKELKNAESINDPKERYFRHCEHFEAAYMHLGSAFYVLETLWNIILKLAGYPSGNQRLGKLVNYLNQKGRTDLVSKLDDANRLLMVRRHLPVHFGRAFAKWHKGHLYVPLSVRKDMMWSQGAQTEDWRRSDRQLAFDLINTEKLINDLHGILIDEYRRFLASKNIQIKRGVGDNETEKVSSLR
jgi:hypothetical protein